MKLFSRNDRDITSSFPDVTDTDTDTDAVGLGDGLVLDGELVTLDERGRPDFGLLQPPTSLRFEPRRGEAPAASGAAGTQPREVVPGLHDDGKATTAILVVVLGETCRCPGSTRVVGHESTAEYGMVEGRVGSAVATARALGTAGL